MFLRSIRWRLQLWHGMILLLVLSGFGYTAYELQHTRELRRVDLELQRRMSTLLGTYRPAFPGGPGGLLPRRRELRRIESERAPQGEELDQNPNSPLPRRGPEIGPRFRGREFEPQPPPEPEFPEFPEGPIYHIVWRHDGTAIRSPEAPEDVTRPAPRTRPGLRERGEYRELTQLAPRGDAIVVGLSMREHDKEFQKLALVLGGSGAAILLLGLAGGWWVASRAIAPIEKISATALKISGGDLSQRIAHDETESELGKLASVLNSTFDRLDAAFNEQARFTIDVSHELRTPVTVVLSQTQTALARERSSADYKDTIQACQRAAQRMRRMIEALLQLARLDAGQERMRRDKFDVGAVARESLEMLRPLAEERGLKLTGDLAPAACNGDSERVGQVITNLVTNAIQYTPSGGEIRVRTETGGGFALCQVVDTGPGIAADDLPRIFNRFYRVEESRSRDKGGTGLGLAISRAIVNAHGGSINVESIVGKGTTFSVRLPC